MGRTGAIARVGVAPVPSALQQQEGQTNDIQAITITGLAVELKDDPQELFGGSVHKNPAISQVEQSVGCHGGTEYEEG